MSETGRKKSDFVFERSEFKSTPWKLSEEPPENLSGPPFFGYFIWWSKKVTPSERHKKISLGLCPTPRFFRKLFKEAFECMEEKL